MLEKYPLERVRAQDEDVTIADRADSSLCEPVKLACMCKGRNAAKVVRRGGAAQQVVHWLCAV
jgi:hypothetical protein